MIGKRLKQIREKNNLNQNEFAEKLGCKQGAISKYELGTVEISNDIAFKLNQVFNVNLNWLFSGEGKPFSEYYGTKHCKNSFEYLMERYLEMALDINDSSKSSTADEIITDLKSITCDNCIYWQVEISDKTHIKKCVSLDINTQRTFYCKNHETPYSKR